MLSTFGRRIVLFLALLVSNSTLGCSGGESSIGKGEPPKESPKEGASKPEPKTPVAKAPGLKSLDVIRIDSFIGISPDFKVYAMSDAKGMRLVDFQTGEPVTSPKWDRDWRFAHSATFSDDVVAVRGGESVKVFSRKTGELEQNIRGPNKGPQFCGNGRVLAMIEFRPGKGHCLILRDIQEKKTIAEVDLGFAGYCSLATAMDRVAGYESETDNITVVEAKTGKLVKKFKSGSFRKRQEFTSGRMPLAIAPSGNLLACESEDAVVLYDIDGGKVTHKLEGHLDMVRAVAFAPNGETIASSADDKTIRFWNVKDGKEINSIKNLPSAASELIFAADCKRIAVVYPGSKVEIRIVEPK